MSEVKTSLEIIEGKDPDFYSGLVNLINYLASTYDDKYEVKPNFSREYLQHPHLGKGGNVFTMAKYLQRYSTTGFKKSENIVDLYKMCHFALFEIERKNQNA